MQSGNNNYEQIELEFERIEDASVLSNFFCGIADMDYFIHNRLQRHIDEEHLQTYIAKSSGTIVAMFAIRPDQLTLDDDDKDEMRMGMEPKPLHAITDTTFLDSNSFDALEVAYLAVSQDHQHQGIGEYIINELCLKAKSDNPNCEFLTVEAYKTNDYSAIGFYLKCAFKPRELPNPAFDVLKMSRVITPVPQDTQEEDE